MRRVLGVLGGALLLTASTSAWPAQAAPPAPVAPTPVTAGHVDVLAPKLADGELEVATVVAGGAQGPTGDIDVLLPDESKFDVMDQKEGEALPSRVWFTATDPFKKPDKPAVGAGPTLGVSLEGLNDPGIQGDVTVELTDYNPPKAEAIFELLTETPEDALTTDRVMSSAPGTRTAALKPGEHKDYVWAFSDPGRYRLVFTVSATTATGAVKSVPVTQTIYVGTTTPITMTATPTTTTVTAEAGATAGQTTLTATVVPDGFKGSPRGVVEFRDGVDALGTEPVPVVGGVAKADFPLPDGKHELTAVFYPKYVNDYAESAESAPVVYTVGTDPDPDPTGSPTPTPSQTPSDDPDPDDSDCTIITDGDIDYAARLDGAKAKAALRDGSTWFDPGEAVVRVPDAAKVALPAGQDFLGAAGTEVWTLPQAAQAGIPSVGWYAEGTSATWKLTKAEGPGKAVMFEIGADGVPKVVFAGAGDSRELTSGEHGHASWGFTAPGVYELSFTHTTPSHGSADGVLAFAVGAYDADDLPACANASGGGGNLADTGAPVLLYGSIGVILVTAGAVLLTGVNRRFGLL
ncbi:choice-of-anchor M domain-containing protein [Actinocorallia sp. A-T 12471]|uniref:choice-of-anchor M domain-containing protein n=1 Tax=Actinocorallia sp. A-T 12471 TaxID=3089813 RepID=UPI0029D02B0F|nr:choice-of-anchor M domain-containing protein [Actinocorallia sp. A-T 12471]MDX6742105.1 choice-of-anchor M domain-containing protein [Actinocorallia sp. A-T 12471]